MPAREPRTQRPRALASAACLRTFSGSIKGAGTIAMAFHGCKSSPQRFRADGQAVLSVYAPGFSRRPSFFLACHLFPGQQKEPGAPTFHRKRTADPWSLFADRSPFARLL